ncbi:MAG TPA: response regulator transcription factor [Bryobacteraceae bacterium]|nr:response regulator transcription factor [Bryobacteraceae bacterium]HZW96327.1 response regulator transcription factor [Candidatus Eremiobacteraceae bacterium]
MRDNKEATQKTIRVLICNKYVLFREGIKSLLREGALIEIVGEADTAKQAIDQAVRLRPDVVLMDLVTPDLSGSEATRRIKAVHPEVRVLILSLRDDETLVSRCFEAGASGYIRKNDHASQLRVAIDAVCRFGEYGSQRAGMA